jgi:hypothetical protein
MKEISCLGPLLFHPHRDGISEVGLLSKQNPMSDNSITNPTGAYGANSENPGVDQQIAMVQEVSKFEELSSHMSVLADKHNAELWTPFVYFLITAIFDDEYPLICFYVVLFTFGKQIRLFQPEILAYGTCNIHCIQVMCEFHRHNDMYIAELIGMFFFYYMYNMNLTYFVLTILITRVNNKMREFRVTRERFRVDIQPQSGEQNIEDELDAYELREIRKQEQEMKTVKRRSKRSKKTGPFVPLTTIDEDLSVVMEEKKEVKMSSTTNDEDLGSEISLDQKNVSKELYSMKKQKNLRDNENFKRYLTLQLEKKQQRARAKGRVAKNKDFKPESQAAADFRQARLQEVCALIGTETESEYRVLTDLALQGVAMLAIVISCKSNAEVFKSIQGYLAGKVSMETLNFIQKRVDTYFKIQPEANDGITFTDTVARFKASTIEVLDAPFGKFLRDVLAITIIQGLSPKKAFHDESMLHTFVEKIEREVSEVSMRTYFDMMFSIMEYSAGLVDAIRRGENWMDYICPTSLSLRVADALADGIKLDAGTLLDCTIERMEKYENEVVSIEALLKEQVRNKNLNPKTVITAEVQYQKIKVLRGKIEAFRKNETWRVKPLCVVMAGDSQIGKSNLIPVFIKATELGAGEEFTPDKIANILPTSKFEDEIKATTKVLSADEMAGLRFTPGQDPGDSSIGSLIKWINNVPTPTNQSAVERKGNVFNRAVLVVGTTNHDDLDAKKIFNYPQAAYNRVLFLEVTLKKEFNDGEGKLDQTKATMMTPVGGIAPPMHNIREFEWKSLRSGEFVKVFDRVQPVCISQYLREYSDKAVLHYAHQAKLEAATKAQSKIQFCDICCLPQTKGWCTCEPCEEAEDVKEVDIIPESWFGVLATTCIDDLALTMLNQFQQSVLSKCSCLALTWFQNYALWFMVLLARSFLYANWLVEGKPRRLGLIALGVALVVGAHAHLVSGVSLVLTYLACAFCVYNAFLGYGQAVKSHTVKLAAEAIHARVAPEYLIKGTIFVSLIASLRLVFTMLEKTLVVSEGDVQTPSSDLKVRQIQRKVYEEQGNIIPKSMQDIIQRRQEHSDWDKKNFVPLDVKDHTIRTMTAAQLASKAESATWKMRIVDQKLTSMAFFLGTNLCQIPRHMWIARHITEDTQVEFEKDGDYFRSYVNAAVDLGQGTDIVLLQLTNGPTMPQMFKYLCTEEYEGLALLVRRNHSTLEPRQTEIHCVPGSIPSSSGVLPERGLTYRLRDLTQRGDCMSPIISLDGPPMIVGFHCGGDAYGNGAATFATDKVESVLLLHDIQCQSGKEFYPFSFDTPVEPSPYGEVTLHVDGPPDKRHSVFHFDAPGSFGVMLRGYDYKMRSKGFSGLRPTLLKVQLEEHGYVTPYTLPRMRSDRDHAACLLKKEDCMLDVQPSLLQKAIEDYVNPLLDHMDATCYPGRPRLSLQDCLNGVADSKFINGIDEKTSCGFGIKGNKKSLVDVVYRPDNGQKVFFPKPELTEEYERLDSLLRQGKRINSIVTTALKSEAVKAGPDGLPAKPSRVFFVMPLATVMAQKSLFGPIAEFCFDNPTLAETAAGINCTTDEWDQLGRWILEKGENRMIAGDYGGWDIRLSAQMIRAGGVVCIQLAERMGYCVEDIRAMRVIIDEIAETLVCYNGAVVSLSGWMKSGAWITLFLNGIVNSLVHRCAFYKKAFEGTFMLRENHATFRDIVNLITMGDDSFGSSKSDEFSMFTMSDFCNSHRMKYTDCNKQPVTQPYMEFSKIDFCKRGFRVCPELDGVMVANLSIDSIMKPMCFYTPGPQSERSYLVSALQSQLRELARHDRETFEKYHDIIAKAANSMQLAHMVGELRWSYDDWIHDLRVRYYPHLISTPPQSE